MGRETIGQAVDSSATDVAPASLKTTSFIRRKNAIASKFSRPPNAFGIASFRLASFVIWPFGRTTTWRREAGIWSVLGNVIWIVVFGWELALVHLVTGLLLMVTIIGIPFGVACWKMIPLSLVPLGRQIVPIADARKDPYGLPA